jgi:ABC-type phosphate transport system substrate-binding protein
MRGPGFRSPAPAPIGARIRAADRPIVLALVVVLVLCSILMACFLARGLPLVEAAQRASRIGELSVTRAGAQASFPATEELAADVVQ